MIPAYRSSMFTFTRYDPVVLEDLNKKAKKAGLHVADAKKRDLYSIRKVKNGKLVAKNVDADEALRVIKQYK
ncbi:hypothetical protein SCNU_02472 [Gordonia neofelifaecis NRRL B-59395]|uniref:Uncharacterized protein n=1 Tax=Gordonia neofelifaecis NRRL B-59395 TaxID=644548 RepID=F1YFJ7_9ACTN|nr:hypothetical protein SCNU_02472 [Gordonia neofelifaecis NRRL B-59395]